MNLQEKAAEARKFYRINTRTDGKKYWSSPNEPGWIHELNYTAHDGMFPDDWKYEFIVKALDAIVDEEDPNEFEADVYTSELHDWFTSHSERSGYADEALQEYGLREIDTAIAYGQLREMQEVYDLVKQYLEDLLLDEEDEEDEDDEDLEDEEE
jgi:hypothetical protein